MLLKIDREKQDEIVAETYLLSSFLNCYFQSNYFIG